MNVLSDSEEDVKQRWCLKSYPMVRLFIELAK